MFECLTRRANFFARTKSRPRTDTELIQCIPTRELKYTIRESSYYRKHCPSLDLEALSRPELNELYARARKYACTSIVNSLYRVDRLRPNEVNHLYCKRSKFRILARTRTNWEEGSMEDTASRRNFLSFSVLEHRNLSHFPGLVLYGYRSHLTPSMIGHISHIDANTLPYANNWTELTEDFDELLDIDDLLDRTLEKRTYCQLSIATNYTDDSGIFYPFLPDCIICIGKINRDAQDANHRTGLPILLLHPADDTICHVHNFYDTPDLAHPYIL